MEPADITCPQCGEVVPPGAAVCPRDGAVVDDGTSGTLIRDPLVGRQMGEYVAKRRVGTGGMGMVYEAVHPIIGKRAAVKILRPELADDPEQMKRLLDEARAVAAIHHRAVIDIFGFGELGDGRHYMVMEFLDGEPLDYYLDRKGPLPVNEAVELLEEILGGLSAAHAVGVIHRDLKPSNVILMSTEEGRKELKVLDFGLAKRASKPDGSVAQTNVARVLGTPEYMAPEQASGQNVGPHTDLYALGVMAFEMFTGKRPFDAPSPLELMLKQMNEPPPRPSTVQPELSEDVDSLVLSLLEKDPAQRPTAEEVRKALVRVRNPVSTGKMRPQRSRSGEGTPRRSKEHKRPPTPAPQTESSGQGTVRAQAVVAKATEKLPEPGVDTTFRVLEPVAPASTLLDSEPTPAAPKRSAADRLSVDETAPDGKALAEAAGEATRRIEERRAAGASPQPAPQEQKSGTRLSRRGTNLVPVKVPGEDTIVPPRRAMWPLAVVAIAVVAIVFGLVVALWPAQTPVDAPVPVKTNAPLPTIGEVPQHGEKRPETPTPAPEKPPEVEKPVGEKPVVNTPPPDETTPVVKKRPKNPKPSRKIPTREELERRMARLERTGKVPTFALDLARRQLAENDSPGSRSAIAQRVADWENQPEAR